MSRLHALSADRQALADRFGAEVPVDLAVPVATTEGGPGVVVITRGGYRIARSMTWGFPRPTIAARHGAAPERVGLVADLTNSMWDGLVQDPRYRCLIPITHFANPDGEPGSKTRTWFSVTDQPIMAWAGFCRKVDGSPVYAGMTMEANAAIPPTNDRMPVLLEDSEWEEWLGGSIADVIRFQFRAPMSGERMRVERTDDRWRSGLGPPSTAPAAQPSLL